MLIRVSGTRKRDESTAVMVRTGFEPMAFELYDALVETENRTSYDSCIFGVLGKWSSVMKTGRQGIESAV